MPGSAVQCKCAELIKVSACSANNLYGWYKALYIARSGVLKSLGWMFGSEKASNVYNRY